MYQPPKAMSPRVQLAALLYATGTAKTKKQAAQMAQINPYYFTLVTNTHEPTKQLINSISDRITDESVDSSVILRTMSRQALKTLYELMSESTNDHIRLKAAQDIADRSPDTSKTQKVQLDGGLTIGAADAKALAAAMVESARERERYESIARDGLIEIDTDARPQLNPPQEVQDVEGTRGKRDDENNSTEAAA